MARMSKRKRLVLEAILGVAVGACLSVVFIQLRPQLANLKRDREARRQTISLVESAKARVLEPVNARPRPFDMRAIVFLPRLYKIPEVIQSGGTPAGFAVGDGTLIATAFHCVEPLQQKARTGALAKPLVISPYYGDVFEAEIVAVDREADLAILRAPWTSHPAFALASEREFAEATELAAVGFPPAELFKDIPVSIGRSPAMETAPVLKLDPASKSETYVVGAVRHAGPGWSGSPMVLPESGKIGGILVTQHIHNIEDKILVKDLRGCGAPVIRSLLEHGGLAEGARHAETAGPSPPDADRAFSAILDSVEAMHRADMECATRRAAELVELRPLSCVSRILYAWFAEIRRDELARKGEDIEFPAVDTLRQSVELAPRSAMARAALGELLCYEERYDEALEHLHVAVELDPDLVFARMFQMRALRGKSPVDAESAGRRFVQAMPECGELWLELALALDEQDKHEEASEAAQKALDLEFSACQRTCLACSIAYQGRPEEFEKHIRRVAETHDCEVYWFSLAALLADLSPDRTEEALKALETAEAHIWSGSDLPEPFKALRQKLGTAAQLDR